MSPNTSTDGETGARALADEYLRLGGQRRIVIDDNETSPREWADEPPEAEAFWRERIEPLGEDQKREVHLLLPTVNRV
jgi:hypothetical protein